MEQQKLIDAINYTLNRIRSDADMYFVAGPFTETFHLLCVAKAEIESLDLKDVEEEFSIFIGRDKIGRIGEWRKFKDAAEDVLDGDQMQQIWDRALKG